MSNLKLATNADGRLELFYTDNNRCIFHRWQTFINNGWSADTPIDRNKPTLAVSFDVERNQNGKLEIFYVGPDGNFYHKRQHNAGDKDEPWDDEGLLSQIQLEEFTIPHRLREYKIGRNRTGRLREEDGRLEIFYISSTDLHVYHKRQIAANSTVWTAEERLPFANIPLCDRIAIGQNKDGRLDLFCTSPDFHVLFHRTQKAADSNLWNFEENFSYKDEAVEMVAGQNKNGRQELFYIGTDSGIYHRWQTNANDDNSWSEEARFGDDDTAQQIAIGRNEDGRLELFYIGSDNKLYHQWQVVANGGWNNAEKRLSNTDKAFDIAVGSNEDGRLEVFYRDEDGKIHQTWQVVINGEWSPSWS